ncbi:hypothetical protein HNY73_008594 [Argiope bruennichi]|uniref:Uncharacterized protein n=1 Tax=Argiope bruennichi TaxID=94029 RepID=A0A8T0F9J0_ARGBR|nr:hypothetical protein HNY73_008594 [Argiope bruennichi]
MQATDPYSQLKSEIISRCGESKSQEIRKLLAGEQLHDRKPSELLRIMQDVPKVTILPISFTGLFLQQLPSNVAIDSCLNTTFDTSNASEIADKILDITPNQVSAVSNATATADSELLSEIKMLRKEIAQMRRHSRSHSRNRKPRFRRKSPASNDDLLVSSEVRLQSAKMHSALQLSAKPQRQGVAATYASPVVLVAFCSR